MCMCVLCMCVYVCKLRLSNFLQPSEMVLLCHGSRTRPTHILSTGMLFMQVLHFIYNHNILLQYLLVWDLLFDRC